MAYDEELAERVRARLARHKDVTEKASFGGLGFYQGGNLVVSVRADTLLVRVGPTRSDLAVTRPGAAPFVSGGRTMRGWVVVTAESVATGVALHDWVDQAHAYAAGLPPK